MYCGMNIRLPGQVSAILVAVSMGVAVFLEGECIFHVPVFIT